MWVAAFPPHHPQYTGCCGWEQVHHNSQAYPLAWGRPFITLTSGPWEREPCAGWFSLLRRVFPAQKGNSQWSSDPIHALLTTSVLPQNRTYRHALILPVPSHRIAEMRLFSCLKTTLTVKWASRFVTFPFKHSLEESTKGWSSAKAHQE